MIWVISVLIWIISHLIWIISVFDLDHFCFDLDHSCFDMDHSRFDLDHSCFDLDHLCFDMDHFCFDLDHFWLLMWIIYAFDLDHCKNHLLEYVEASQPGRLKVFREELDKIVAPEEIEACIRLLAKMLIDFTYDQIERSRRRAILESIQLGRNAKTNSEIRVRILSYLQEGVGKENFDSLLELTDVKLTPWRDIADRIQYSKI